MLGSFVDDIVKYFQFDQTNIDNIVFKLFYKGCFILFLMGSTVGLLSQYFGDPINCNFPGSINDLANDYCWIHGQFYIPPGKFCKQTAAKKKSILNSDWLIKIFW